MIYSFKRNYNLIPPLPQRCAGREIIAITNKRKKY